MDYYHGKCASFFPDSYCISRDKIKASLQKTMRKTIIKNWEMGNWVLVKKTIIYHSNNIKKNHKVKWFDISLV